MLRSEYYSIYVAAIQQKLTVNVSSFFFKFSGSKCRHNAFYRKFKLLWFALQLSVSIKIATKGYGLLLWHMCNYDDFRTRALATPSQLRNLLSFAEFSCSCWSDANRVHFIKHTYTCHNSTMHATYLPTYVHSRMCMKCVTGDGKSDNCNNNGKCKAISCYSENTLAAQFYASLYE